MRSIDLIQPRHSYASEQGEGHIYTNTSLWTIGAQLQQAGVEVSFHDENIAPAKIHSNIVGINLLGAPYIPVVIEKIKELRKTHGEELAVVLGGQVMTTKQGLTEPQFQKLFGKNVHNGMKPGVRSELLNLEKIQSEFHTSLIPVYENMSDELFAKYFSREISFFLSQGCAQGCSFCAAVKGTAEKYRDFEIIYQDLYYIAERLSKLSINHVSMYLTNLDVRQSPLLLNMFADTVQQVKNAFPQFTFKMRGLAGTAYFMKMHKNHPQVIRKMVDIGFDTAGYGVDGMGEEVWKGVKKPQNTEENTLGAIEISRKEYDITPELLMVFGHVGVDNKESLQRDLEFVKAMVHGYKAIPRPHIAKPFIPGNDGRHDKEFAQKIETLIKKPYLFQSLDFTALANKLTHGDQKFVDMVNKYYLEMCKIDGNTTIPIEPYEIGDDKKTLDIKKHNNEGKFDR